MFARMTGPLTDVLAAQDQDVENGEGSGARAAIPAPAQGALMKGVEVGSADVVEDHALGV